MKKYLPFFIGVFCGGIIATIIFFIPVISNGIENADWSKAVVWFSIFLGALIPILVNHYSIRRQEIIKLKAKMASMRLDDINTSRAIIEFMKMTTYTEYTTKTLKINYSPTVQDSSAPTLRSLIIMQNHEYFDNWRLQQNAAFQTLNKLNYNKLNKTLFYCLNYILNLETAINELPDSSMPQVGIVIKNDFFEMHDQIMEAIDDYIENHLFRLKYMVSTKKDKEEFDPEILKDNNLYKYRIEFDKLK